MRLARTVFAFCLLVSIAFGQVRLSTITGAITDPDAGAVAGITVNARNVMTGAAYSAVRAANGGFTIRGATPGTYELSVPAMGFTYAPLVRKDLIVREGETLR